MQSLFELLRSVSYFEVFVRIEGYGVVKYRRVMMTERQYREKIAEGLGSRLYIRFDNALNPLVDDKVK